MYEPIIAILAMFAGGMLLTHTLPRNEDAGCSAEEDSSKGSVLDPKALEDRLRVRDSERKMS